MLKLAKLAAFSALCWLLGEAAWTVRQARQNARAELDQAQAAAGRRLDAFQVGIKAEIASAERDLLQRLDTGLKSADHHLGTLNETLDKSAYTALAIVDVRAGEALKQLEPVTGKAAALVQDAQDSLDDLYPDLKATVASVDVAATSIAHTAEDAQATSGEFRRAVPVMLTGFNHIIDNSDLTTKSTAQGMAHFAFAMKNLADATKPIPKWARWTFGIAGALAPTAAGAVGIAAATGAFHR